jgi:hypothetical protein
MAFASLLHIVPNLFKVMKEGIYVTVHPFEKVLYGAKMGYR